MRSETYALLQIPPKKYLQFQNQNSIFPVARTLLSASQILLEAYFIGLETNASIKNGMTCMRLIQNFSFIALSILALSKSGLASAEFVNLSCKSDSDEKCDGTVESNTARIRCSGKLHYLGFVWEGQFGSREYQSQDQSAGLTIADAENLPTNAVFTVDGETRAMTCVEWK
jgi:hypothetical protein